jgi:ribosome assembly protein SQT1
MSNTREHELDPEEEQDHELNDEDIVEVIEDEGDEPMDDEDDDDNEKYDGEIVIGAPMPGEEEELANMEQMMEDNTLGSTCQSTFHVKGVE